MRQRFCVGITQLIFTLSPGIFFKSGTDSSLGCNVTDVDIVMPEGKEYSVQQSYQGLCFFIP
jgi:hypothetical protein